MPDLNPLAGLISDDDYQVLAAHDLLSERGIRDYQMRRRFLELRRSQMPAWEALECLRSEHPYLQADTIRKIVYHTGGHRETEAVRPSTPPSSLRSR